jgi:hypothetical protein
MVLGAEATRTWWNLECKTHVDYRKLLRNLGFQLRRLGITDLSKLVFLWFDLGKINDLRGKIFWTFSFVQLTWNDE